MIRIRRHPLNAYARDFVTGDLHGETGMLEAALARIAFDPVRDRLFSVGDLIDRGPNSRQALSLLDSPYFYPVLGNHEAMMIEAVLHGREHERWMEGGGEWHRFHVVHAGLVDVDDQPLTDAVVDAPDATANIDQRALLWSRGLARRYKWTHKEGILDSERWRAGLSLTFCGHTPVPEPGLLLSHYFVDGGVGSEIYLAPSEQPQLHVIDSAAQEIARADSHAG